MSCRYISRALPGFCASSAAFIDSSVLQESLPCLLTKILSGTVNISVGSGVPQKDIDKEGKYCFR